MCMRVYIRGVGLQSFSVCTYVYGSVHILHTYIHLRTYIYIYMSVHICVCECTYIRECRIIEVSDYRVSLYVHMCMGVYIFPM